MPKHYRKPGKKKEGNAARFITRSQAVKHLQVSLPVFRRLCILKGIFPREPKKKVKGNHQTYYHTKDILFLRHEPLVEKFREIRAYDKKVKKAWKKKNADLAKRLLSRKPDYTLDRLIRERYPRFVDALGDLDDCLSMVHLFASLPASVSEKIEVKRIHNCRRLCHEWQAYITRTHKLRKTFISVKGIYYQAEIEGQKVTWITPHALQQVVTDDIDFNVMLTFVEFYETLLAFVNFKLYHSISVRYPPILDPQLEALAADLYALSRYLEAKASSVALVGPENQHDDQQLGKKPDESELRLAQLQHQLHSNEPSLMHLVENTAKEDDEDEETRECKSLFKDMKFFLSREVPRESLLFIIPAFGGLVSWEGGGAPFKETDQTITYQIVDRPVQGHRFLSREYVQPQWIFDCVNARIILPTDEYVVGRVPPPHMSPFVDNEKEGYVPDYAEKIKRLQAAAKKQILPMPGIGKEDMDEPQSLLVEGVINRSEDNEAAAKKQRMLELEKKYHEELKMELQGVSAPPSSKEERSTEDEDDRDENVPGGSDAVADDITIMEKLMMPRKQKELLKAMEISNKRKAEKNELLLSRKRKAQASQTSEKQRSK